MTLRISGGRFGFFLVDFSSSVPPEDSLSGLFVQLRARDEEFVVLSVPALDSNHSAIVERFCARMLLPFETVCDHGLYRRQVGEPGWTVVGGGNWRRDEDAGCVELSGHSPAYGPFDPDGLQENLRAIPGWGHTDIRLREES